MYHQSKKSIHRPLSILRSFVAVFLLTILNGCDFDSLLDPSLQWAVIDQGKVTSVLTKLASKQNPYPEGSKSDELLNIDKRNIERQIRNLRTQVKDRCMKIESEKADTTKSKSSDRIRIITPGMAYDRSSAYAKCESKVAEDPLISDLTKKQADINHFFKQKAMHKRKVQGAVSAYLKLILEERFEDEFDLVLLKRDGIVLYNKSHIVIDVTDKLLEHISSSEPKIPVE